MRRSRRVASALLLGVLTTSIGNAAEIIWCSNGTGTWTDPWNWIGGVVPNSSDTLSLRGWQPLANAGWTVTASNGANVSNIKDGRRSTTWSSGLNQVSGQWVVVNLGSVQTFGGIKMESTVGTDYPRGVEVYVSNSNGSWVGPVGSATGTGNDVDVSFASQTYQWIKIQLNTGQANYWQMAELTVYGTAAGTMLSTAGMTGSSPSGGTPGNALDWTAGTRWTSGAPQAAGQYLQLDLGSSRPIQAIAMDARGFTNDYPRDFKVEVSDSAGSGFSQVAAATPTSEFILATFSSATKRYIRVTLNSNGPVGNTTTNWWSIDQFYVYGTPTTCTTAASTTVAGIKHANAATFVQAAGHTLSVTGNWAQTAGAFTGGTSTISVAGDFDYSGGTFTSTNDLLQIAGAFNNTAGNFAHNSGRVLLNSTGSKTLATAGDSFNSLIINDGLVGYWPFEETSGPSLDSSGWGRSATWVNATNDNAAHATTNFTNTRSLGFASATSDYATITAPDISTITIAGWVYSISRNSSYTRIIDMPAFEVSFEDTSNPSPNVDNSVAWTVYNSGGQYSWRTPANSIGDGAWYHIAVTFTGTNTGQVYINGVNQMLTTVATEVGTVSSNIGTGYIANSQALNRGWNGYLDDLRIYDRVLSAAEIADLYGGGQRTAPVGTHTLSGTLTTVSDLVLASGTLDVSSACSGPCGITVGGDWLNLGGAFTPRTGTVTFNGSGGVIQSDRVPFYNVTFNDTDTWTLQDRLYVDNTLAMSASGILAQSSSNYDIHAGTLNKTTGTISGAGDVVLDAGSAKTLIVNSVGTGLRIESPLDSGLVGYWKVDEGRGTTAYDRSGNNQNGTLTNSPIWSASVPTSPAMPIDDAGSVYLDGSSSHVRVSRTAALEPASVTVSFWIKRNGTQTNSAKVLDKTVNNSVATPWQSYSFQMNGFGNDSGQVSFETGFTDNAFQSLYSTANAVPDGTWTHVVGVYDPSGTAPQKRLYINGALNNSVTESRALKYDATSTGDLYFGQNGGSSQWYDGNINDVRIYNRGLATNEVSALYTSGYTTGSTVVYSLGATATMGSSLKIDSGILDAVNFQSSITATTTISGGEYRIGSNSSGQTFAGGLTVNRYGQLRLASANGKAIMGAGSTLSMDGTLTASSASAAIQSASGTYTFNIGTTATATPTLNITGLQVKNTSANGMYINTNTSSVTTFTRFDNIAFSNGAGTGAGNYNLRIYAASLYLASNGCTFDNGVSATVANNVRLVGNGTGDGETRAIFGGATCSSNQTSCEAYDSDDDNEVPAPGPNGVGDDTTNLGAVIQWVSSASADTSGSIEGFPTAAFDWNNFSYYATYAAYHDTNGGTADTVFVRTATGAPDYSWSTPSNETIIGTPRWDTVSNVHYLYVATTSGKVYRLINDTVGNTLAPDPASPWSGSYYDCTCTITTPLAHTTTTLYWGGTAAAVHKLWSLVKTTKVLVGAALNTTYATTNTAPALWGSSPTYAFLGLAGHIVKFNVTAQSMSDDNTNPGGSTPVTGRITIILNKLYAGDDNGWLWALDPANMSGTARLWSYRNHASAIKSHYFDPAYARVYFGDQDGHMMVVDSNGAAVTGYPWSTGGGAFATAPFYQSGVIVAGTSSGSLYFIDQNNGSGPAKFQTYEFGSNTAVSGIGYDPVTSRYMVSTANAANKDGKLYYFAVVPDPTAPL